MDERMEGKMLALIKLSLIDLDAEMQTGRKALASVND